MAANKPEEQITDYPGKGIPAVDAAIKDGTWKIKMDKNSNKPFFYNPISKETTWDLAKKLGVPAVPATATATRAKSPVKPSTNSNTNNVAASSPTTTSERPKSPVRQSIGNSYELSSTTTATNKSSNQQQQQQNYDPQQLSDPIQRLLQHNKRLVGDIASHEAESIKAGMATFETRLDLLVHANNVLAVQLDRRNQDANALQQALTEAHDTIHKLKNDVKNHEDAKALTSFAKTSLLSDGGMKVSNEEAKRSIAIALETVGRTVVHLQEQNRSLSATISALTAQLVQNVQTSNAARSMESVADQPHEWWRNAKGYSVAALTSRFLDSPGRNALCPKCALRISDFRDQLLREVPVNEAEKQANEKAMQQQQREYQGGSGGAYGNDGNYSPPIAARINLQPAPTPLNGLFPGGNNNNGNNNNNNSVQNRNQANSTQRVQPQYVPVTLFNNNNNNNNNARASVGGGGNGGGGGGAFSSVANNYSSNNNNINSSVTRSTPNVNNNNNNNGNSTIRPGNLFGGR